MISFGGGGGGENLPPLWALLEVLELPSPLIFSCAWVMKHWNTGTSTS